MLSSRSVWSETNGLHSLESEPSTAIIYSFVKFILSAESPVKIQPPPGQSVLESLSILKTISFQSQHTNHHASQMKWKKSAWKIPMLCWSKSLSNVPQLWWGAVGGGALHLDQYHRQLPNNWKKCVLTNTSEPELYSSPKRLSILANVFQKFQPSEKKTS